MACESCRLQTRAFVQASLASRAARSPVSIASSRFTNLSSSSSSSLSSSRAQRTAQARRFSTTPPARLLNRFGGGLSDSYRVLGASERLFKVCSQPADYHIKEEDRKNDRVRRRDDGEELGTPVSVNNVWNKRFRLQPSFSTWSHVTMLHLYILSARLRMLDRDEYRNWQQQLIDHFFFECEKKMHLDHGIVSSALRQRYLKDIFVQWRGLLLAYDEGLVKGDATLASAVWRNLFKGDADVDPRALLAVVGWMRASLLALEGTSDTTFPQRAQEILEKPVEVFWTRLEEPLRKGPVQGAVETDAAEGSDPMKSGQQAMA